MSEPGYGRHAVLVDVGYVYATAGLLVASNISRRAFAVNVDGLVAALIDRVRTKVPGDLLRVYWYDAARDRVPTVEHRLVATIPNVKVRLGNLNAAGQQKGVDAQLRQDLEALARNRAVTDVVLITGDEDMVSAVEAAQAYGVRVHVWGIEPPYGVNQAERLVWEADTRDELDADFIRPFVTVNVSAVLPPTATRPTPASVMAPARRPVPVPSGASRPTPGPALLLPPPVSPPQLGPSQKDMEAVGQRIAERWLVTRGRDNVGDLLPGPILPVVIDRELLTEAEQILDRSLRPFEDARRALRNGFFDRLRREFGYESSGPLRHTIGEATDRTDP